MKIYAQVLGTATGDSTPTILIFFDQKRYLFNCGEGTQRFCTEHKAHILEYNIYMFTSLGTKKNDHFYSILFLGFILTVYFIFVCFCLIQIYIKKRADKAGAGEGRLPDAIALGQHGRIARYGLFFFFFFTIFFLIIVMGGILPFYVHAYASRCAVDGVRCGAAHPRPAHDLAIWPTAHAQLHRQLALFHQSVFPCSHHGWMHARDISSSSMCSRRHMIWNVREFVENDAHPEAAVYDDGNLRITAVELVLPSEPELKPCTSATPPPVPMAEGSDTPAEPSKGKEKEEEQEAENPEPDATGMEPTEGASTRKRKSRSNQPICYSSVVDSPAYLDGDRSSKIVLGRDFGNRSATSATCKRTKSIPRFDRTLATIIAALLQIKRELSC